MKKEVVTTTKALPPRYVSIQELQREIQPLIVPVLARVKALVISGARSYALADEILTKLRYARSIIKEKMDSILDPINAARSAALKIRHDLDDPLADAEDTLRTGMKTFKLGEARKVADEQARRDREAAELRRLAGERERQAQNAKTRLMAARLAAQSQDLEEKAEEVEAAPIPAPVQVRNSGTRTIPKWRIISTGDFIQHVAGGWAPDECLTVDKAVMDRLFKTRPDFKDWPGVECYDDIQIVGR